MKLAVREPETATLAADLAGRDGLVASRLAVVECRRAARRASHRRVLQTVDQILDAIHLIEVTPAILDAAAAADPLLLRSLDAIHLATALSVGHAPRAGPHDEVHLHGAAVLPRRFAVAAVGAAGAGAGVRSVSR